MTFLCEATLSINFSVESAIPHTMAKHFVISEHREKFVAEHRGLSSRTGFPRLLLTKVTLFFEFFGNWS